jgi:hypothetical protein
MADKAKDESIDPVKLGGSVLAAIAGFALLMHRMPHMGYVEVHEDAPRASRPASPPPMPKPEAPKPAAPTSAPASPAVKMAAIPAAPKLLLSEPLTAKIEPELGIRTTEEVGDICAGEIGLLCYEMSPNQWRGCLSPYKSSLRSDCRKALKAWKN